MIGGELLLGLEVEVSESGVIERLGPHTGVPDEYVLSPGFVNAHSHLEYRGMLGQLKETEYGPWLREITLAKEKQTMDQVRQDCYTAAHENWNAGVRLIAEHSDRPYSAEALASVGVKGVIFQEVITLFDGDKIDEKLAAVKQKAQSQRGKGLPVHVSPHTLYTVDEETLRLLAQGNTPLSVHIGESPTESSFFHDGAGPISELYARVGLPSRHTGRTIFEEARALGFVRQGVQFVHACDLQPADFPEMAQAGVTVAHCPRSNIALGCPNAAIREMLDAGVKVGIGLDSPASSGPIDMFAEMRAALDVSYRRGRHISPEEVWLMATTWGADSLGHEDWEIEVGSDVPLIRIACHVGTTEELISAGGVVSPV